MELQQSIFALFALPLFVGINLLFIFFIKKIAKGRGR